MDMEELSGVWERDVRPSSGLILPASLEPSGRETPVSVDSIPLEWDHTVDVGGSSSPEDEDEATYYSALSGIVICSCLLQLNMFKITTIQKKKTFPIVHFVS